MQNYIIAIIMHADILSLIIVLTALDVKDIASFLIDQIALCLREADRHKLRSAAQASVWAAFHRMWERKNISDRWSSFMTNLPSPVEETSLGLQLILDRLLSTVSTAYTAGCDLSREKYLLTEKYWMYGRTLLKPSHVFTRNTAWNY